MNSISLNGSDMVDGDIIIIFIDISMFVMIMLMIRNGMNIVKLIWKLVFSLFVMNVGISSDSGMLLGFCIGVVFEIFVNSVRLVLWVCFSMKVLNGVMLCCMVCFIGIELLENGL